MDGSDDPVITIELDGTVYFFNDKESKEAFDKAYDALPADRRNEVDGILTEKLNAISRSLSPYAGLPTLARNEIHTVIGRTREPGIERFLDENIETATAKDEPETDKDGYRCVRSWVSSRRIRTCHTPTTFVTIWEKDGRFRVQTVLYRNSTAWRLDTLLYTLAQRSMSIRLESELKAREKLKTYLSSVQWLSYELSGAFLEESPSGVVYILRKGYPTIAFRMGHKGGIAPIAALCLHPLAYAADSFAGALAPSDEVIAHLLMIRADEHGFWKQANHHDLSEPMSGL